MKILTKTKILDYGADEFTLKPISPENVADKLFMLLTRALLFQKIDNLSYVLY